VQRAHRDVEAAGGGRRNEGRVWQGKGLGRKWAVV
jgi:hypothetical protein